MKIKIEDFNKKMNQIIISVNVGYIKPMKCFICINPYDDKKLYSSLVNQFYQKLENITSLDILKYFLESFHLLWNNIYSYRYKNYEIIKSFKGNLPSNGFNYFIDGHWYTIIEY